MADGKKLAKADAAQSSMEQIAPANWTQVTIRPSMLGGASISGLTKLKARASNMCGQKEDGCWQMLTSQQQSGAWGTLSVPSNQMTRIEAEATISGQQGDEQVPLIPTVGSFGCEQPARTITMFATQEEIVPPQDESVMVSLIAHRCVNKDDHRDRTRTTRITSATAEVCDGTKSQTSNATKPARITGTILDDIVIFKLEKDKNYLFRARFEEECANTCPTFPFVSCADRDKEISICVEPRERVVNLLCIDACGKAVEPDFFVDQGEGWKQQSKGQGGTYTLTGLRAGRLRFRSENYKFTPEEIQVDERMNQAHVLEAKKVQTTVDSGGIEEIFLEIAEEIGQGEQALFNILTLEGKLIKTLKAENGRATYSAAADQPYLIRALVDGKVCGEQMHFPKLLTAGGAK
jgi:hypothetical protein